MNSNESKPAPEETDFAWFAARSSDILRYSERKKYLHVIAFIMAFIYIYINKLGIDILS